MASAIQLKSTAYGQNAGGGSAPRLLHANKVASQPNLPACTLERVDTRKDLRGVMTYFSLLLLLFVTLWLGDDIYFDIIYLMCVCVMCIVCV